jgi:hypothetical protein
MFELIKILVDKIVGQLSYEAIAKHRKEKQLTKLGTELMLLYMSLNGVVVVGEKILDKLQDMAKGFRVGDPERIAATPEWLFKELRALLKEQASQIVNVIGSCYRLRVELGVIDVDGGRTLARLLDIKVGLLRNQICELWPEIWGGIRTGTSRLIESDDIGFLRSFKEGSVDQLLFETGAPFWRVDRAAIKAVWNSGVQVPLEGPGPTQDASEEISQIKGKREPGGHHSGRSAAPPGDRADFLDQRCSARSA